MVLTRSVSAVLVHDGRPYDSHLHKGKTMNIRVLLAFAAILSLVGFVGTANADSLVINNGDASVWTNPDTSPNNAPLPVGAANAQNLYTTDGSDGNWTMGNGNASDVWAYKPAAGTFNSPLPGSHQVIATDNYNDNAIVQDLSVSNPDLGVLHAGYTWTLSLTVAIPKAGAANLDTNGGISNGTSAGITFGFGDIDATAQFTGSAFNTNYSNDGSLAAGSVHTLTAVLNSDDPTNVNGGISFDQTGTYWDGDRIGLFIDISGPNTMVTDFAITRTANAVPEPSTLVLLASGLVGLLAYAWRKRK
jgi:hypothetical protein